MSAGFRVSKKSLLFVKKFFFIKLSLNSTSVTPCSPHRKVNYARLHVCVASSFFKGVAHTHTHTPKEMCFIAVFPNLFYAVLHQLNIKSQYRPLIQVYMKRQKVWTIILFKCISFIRSTNEETEIHKKCFIFIVFY